MADQITVFCRLPNGIILSLFPEGEAQRRASSNKNKNLVLNPMREIGKITLNGATDSSSGYIAERNLMLGKAGRTLVDKDFWEAWLRQNENSDLVRENLIFAEAKSSKGEAKLKEFATEKTGLEPREQNELAA
ncbi:hypothetical protein FAI41_04410 [Acetobacteraceae bacterium]|nr:hypothetical protein FAI41_04410 [Acetobacteraceae bacterium]